MLILIVDVDECKKNATICGGDAECNNKPGSYECLCKPGFEKAKTGECIDVNECNRDPRPCLPNAKCENTRGSCTCKCRPGFDGDGRYKCSGKF